jgi:hypothetical protein
LVDQINFGVRDGEVGEGQQVVLGVAQHGFHLRELAAEHAGDHVELGVHVLGVGLGEDRADRGGDHLGVALGHPGEHEVLRSAPGSAARPHRAAPRRSPA